MKYIASFLLLFFCVLTSSAQQERFDIATYTVPPGWKKVNNGADVVGYAITNNKKGTYCQLAIFKSMPTTGSARLDFDTDWNDLISKPYGIMVKPEPGAPRSEGGWEVRSGVAPYDFNGGKSMAILVTMSGYSTRMSISILTNTQDYQASVDRFLTSVVLKEPGAGEVTSQKTTPEPSGPPDISGFMFTNTNFDDGWVSTIHDDWVKVTKGAISVLLHYATNRIDLSSADYATIGQNAWNTLIAPRYRNMENYFQFRGSMDYERPYFIAADLVDNSSGKRSYVVLFKRGNSGWIEIISPSKSSFVAMYGIDIHTVDYYADSRIWEPLQKMAWYNRFAVGASDLNGKWTNKFSGMIQYVNAYTGADAGMNTNSSTEVFQFTGSAYTWELKAASGMVGNLKFQGAKSSGTFSMPSNWQVKFSDIEGKPRTYNAYFSCVKGARLLWLEDSAHANGYTSYGKTE